eukprot:m51a1_g1801 hypothetical protein (763) ;mRNA; r:444495-447086
MDALGAGGTSAAALIDQQMLEPQLANLVDVTCAFGNLAGVLSDIVAQVNRQTQGLARAQESLVQCREELAKQVARSSQKERDLENMISTLRQELRAATTEELFMNFKYDAEKKNRDMEEYSGKLREDLHSIQEEVRTLSGEIAQATSDMGSIRVDVSRVLSDLPELREEISRGLGDLDKELQKHINTETNGPPVTAEDVKGMIKAEVTTASEASDSRTGATLQRLEDLIRSTENDIQRSTELKLKLLTPLDAFDRFKRDVEKMKVTEVTKQLKAVAKNQARMQADLKVFSSVVESDSKKVERCRESLDLKADKKALEELARFLYVKLKENPALLNTVGAIPQALVAPRAPSAAADGATAPAADAATTEQAPPQSAESAPPESAGEDKEDGEVDASLLESPPLSDSHRGEQPPAQQAPPHRETPDATAVMMAAAAAAIEDKEGEQPGPGILEQLSGAFGGSVASELGDRMDRLGESHAELQGKVADVRRDLSEMGHFIEALSSDLKGVKEHLRNNQLAAQQQAQGVVVGQSANLSLESREKELQSQQVNVDLSRQIERLSQQFSEVLRKKADLSAIEQMLVEKENERRQEIDMLQQTVERKVGHDELSGLKRAMEKDLQRSIAQMQTSEEDDGRASKSAFTRTGLQKCIACDRLVGSTADHACEAAAPEPTAAVRDGWFDLAPNIAYKRWIVKDLLKATRDGARSFVPPPQGPGGPGTAGGGRSKPGTGGDKLPSKPGSPGKKGATPSLPPISGASATAGSQP